jgi:hypothetical protein
MPLWTRVLDRPFDEALVALGFLRALDRASQRRRDWPAEGVQRLLRILRRPGSLGDVCARFGLFADEREARHVREDWFGENGKGWWPTQPMEALFRKGMIRAIELLRAHDLPLASYWHVGRWTRRAQITFAVSAHQITLLISTPPPRVRGARGRAVANPKVWVIAAGARKQVVSRAARTPTPDDEPHLPPIPCL